MCSSGRPQHTVNPTISVKHSSWPAADWPSSAPPSTAPDRTRSLVPAEAGPVPPVHGPPSRHRPGPATDRHLLRPMAARPETDRRSMKGHRGRLSVIAAEPDGTRQVPPMPPRYRGAGRPDVPRYRGGMGGTCPECGRHGVSLMFGLPVPKAQLAAAAGRLVLVAASNRTSRPTGNVLTIAAGVTRTNQTGRPPCSRFSRPTATTTM